MKYGRSRSISFANRFAGLALGCLLSGPALAVDCPATVIGAIEADALARLSAHIDQASVGMATANPTEDPKILLTRGEDIPSIIRENIINPFGLPNAALAGAYVGDYSSGTRGDFLNLPDDDRVLCLLTPALEVFLTDDVTHHYATIFAVDLKADTVTLLDPWAKVSFLLPGRNLAGVNAEITDRGNRQPLLTLKLSEFRQVLRGMIQWYFAPEMASTIETLYPELAASPDFLAWKYGTILGAGQFETGLMAALELQSAAEGKDSPALATLSRAASDLYPGMMSGFSNRPDGEAGFAKDFPSFASELPWTVRWLLAERLIEFGRLDLAAGLLRAYVAADPADVDFRVALAEVLAATGDTQAARQEAEAARKQWRTDVKAMIDVPTEDEAVAYFLPHVKDTIAFELFQHRNERLLLLEARLRYLLDRDPSGIEDIIAYMQDYGSAEFLAGFAEEMLLTLHIISGASGEAAVLPAMGEIRDERQADFVAEGAFVHFTTASDLAAAPELGAAIKSVPGFAERICGKGKDGTAVPAQNDAYRKSFDAFCSTLPAAPTP